MKRKYTKFREEPKAYECDSIKCKWQGTTEQQVSKRISSNESVLTCPKCGHDTFRGLLELPNSESNEQ